MTQTIVESKTKTAIIGFDQPFCVIGERINPTGRKKLAAELEAGDFSTVEKDALAQVAAGATVLDVNAGVVYNSNPDPNQTEPPLMRKMIEMVQGLVDVPLCIDSSVPGALEAGLEVCEGRPLLNSITGKRNGWRRSCRWSRSSTYRWWQSPMTTPAFPKTLTCALPWPRRSWNAPPISAFQPMMWWSIRW